MGALGTFIYMSVTGKLLSAYLDQQAISALLVRTFAATIPGSLMT